MQPPNLKSIQDFAVEAAVAAGEITLRYFQTDLTPELKADQTPVTIADREAEQFLRTRIAAAFPAHSILGEEFGETPGSGTSSESGRSPARWIIDPIDGTFSFIAGVPLYSVLIGFEWAGELVAGVIHLPALKETIHAARGEGCRWNGKPARVNDISQLSQARLLHGGVKSIYKHGRGPAFERLRDGCKTDRSWCDAYAYALVATGRAEIALDPIMSLWDVAALVPILTEAGGKITDWSGGTAKRHQETIATNGRLHDEVIAAVKR